MSKTKRLTLDAVKATAFVGGLVQKEIEVDGNKFDVWIKPNSYEHVVNVLSHMDGSDRIASMISTSVVDESGKPIFTFEDVTGEADEARGPLSSAFTVALLAAINEVTLGKS